MTCKPYDQEADTRIEIAAGTVTRRPASERYMEIQRIRAERTKRENEYAAVHCGCLRCKIAAGFSLDDD